MGDLQVCPEHRERTLRYLQSTRRAVPIVLATLSLGVAAVLALPALGFVWGGALGIAAIGLVMATLPLPTPQTVQWLGLRKSILLVRFLGLVIVGVAVLFYLEQRY
jgi:uncharacterized membrane protein